MFYKWQLSNWKLEDFYLVFLIKEMQEKVFGLAFFLRKKNQQTKMSGFVLMPQEASWVI